MILITTPTGDIGSKILAIILKSNEAIRVIVRDATKLDSAVKNRVEIIEGSTDDATTVNKAFIGVDAVFWLVPPNGTTDDLNAYYLRFNHVAADAARAQNVKRIVWVSTLGTDLGDNSGHLSAAKAGDAPLLETRIAARILDPAAFMENLLHAVSSIKDQSTFYWANDPDKVFHVIATADIAAKAAELLLDHTWTGQEHIPLLSSDNLTPNQIAEVISGVLGKPVGYKQIKPEDYKNTMSKYGSSNAVAQGFADMAVAQNNGVYFAEAEKAERAPTSFQTWCEEVLKPFFEEA
jgi:uncharacterized protein YbjT (DUF2867 family)